MKHINVKKPPESIGASFVKVSWLEPEILQLKVGTTVQTPIVRVE